MKSQEFRKFSNLQVMLSILAEIAASKSVSSGNFDTHRQIRESIDFVSFKKTNRP